jgi:hypothetical protein
MKLCIFERLRRNSNRPPSVLIISEPERRAFSATESIESPFGQAIAPREPAIETEPSARAAPIAAGAS